MGTYTYYISIISYTIHPIILYILYNMCIYIYICRMYIYTYLCAYTYIHNYMYTVYINLWLINMVIKHFVNGDAHQIGGASILFLGQ